MAGSYKRIAGSDECKRFARMAGSYKGVVGFHNLDVGARHAGERFTGKSTRPAWQRSRPKKGPGNPGPSIACR